MGYTRRVLRIGVGLVLLGSALLAPTAASAAPTCYDPAPSTVSDSANHWHGLKVTVSFSYVTCLAKVTIENPSTNWATDVGMSLWQRPGACDENAPNGTRLALWNSLEGLPPGGKHTLSVASSAGRCFRGYSRIGGVVDGADVYARVP